MITLSNGHSFEYMVASGALGFDSRGWFWDKPFIELGLIKPELFTVVTRTLTLYPRLYPVSNLSWVRPWTWLPWSPWSCVRFIPHGGAVNKVGLYNPGFHWWCTEVAERRYKGVIDIPLVVSLFGSKEELIKMAHFLNRYYFIAIEINVSCPNIKHKEQTTRTIIESVMAVKEVSRRPIIVKLSVDNDYEQIARELVGYAEAVSFNSVSWYLLFPGYVSPVAGIGQEGGGGVSGKPAQKLNWPAAAAVARQKTLPVIFPSIMEYEDMAKVRRMGASAVSFGAIHLRTPWAPTAFVQREAEERRIDKIMERIPNSG